MSETLAEREKRQIRMLREVTVGPYWDRIRSLEQEAQAAIKAAVNVAVRAGK